MNSPARAIMTDLGLLKKPILEKTAWVLFGFSLSLDVITTLILVHNIGIQAEQNPFLRDILAVNSFFYIPIACTAYLILYFLSRYFNKKSKVAIPGWDVYYLIFLSTPLALAFVEFIVAYHNFYLIVDML
ncbi:MAG: hypothetical protein LUO93_06695 [Methanomicrobiales archaeon]|nr:hypothetical protein [Methanomicrobiales archaeon]